MHDTMVQLCKDALMPQNLKVHSRPPPQSLHDAATVAALRRSCRASRHAKVCAIPSRTDARHFTAVLRRRVAVRRTICRRRWVVLLLLNCRNSKRRRGKKAGGKCRSLFPFSVMMTIDGLSFRSIIHNSLNLQCGLSMTF